MLLTAFVVVFGMILLGYVLRVTQVFDAVFWRSSERLVYFLALPALLIVTMANAPLEELALLRLIPALLAPYLLISVGLALHARHSGVYAPGVFSPTMQGSIRFNSYIGLAIAAALYGEAGLLIASVAFGLLIPFVNVCAVLAVLIDPVPPGHTRPPVARLLLSNPLVIACVIGVAINLAPISLPVVAIAWGEALGQIALPLGLMAVGAGLRLTRLHQHAGALFGSSVLKLTVLPALTWLTTTLTGLETQTVVTATLLAALPTAASSYILSRQLGADATLMASIISLQTLLGMITLPVVVLLAGTGWR